MIHLPPTGHEVFGSKLQLFNLQTTAPTDKTVEYRSFGHILSLLKQNLKFQVNNIRNGGLQPSKRSPMGPNFICQHLGIWTGKVIVIIKGPKTGKPAALHRFLVRDLNILLFGDLLVYFNCSEMRRRIWNRWRPLLNSPICLTVLKKSPWTSPIWRWWTSLTNVLSCSCSFVPWVVGFGLLAYPS